MRYFVDFAYNGSAFHGSQRQPNAVSVQEVLENAFSTILREPIALTFAGRTDAGVHAEHMVAHFDSQAQVQLSSIIYSSMPLGTGSSMPKACLRLNRLLPSSISVHNIYPVPDDWHARFSALARTYEYRITTDKDPFRQGLVTRVAPGLNFELMNKAAKILLGTHDFASFCKVHTDVKTTICTITQAEWSNFQQPDGPTSNSAAVFTITADRFLRNMVRAVVGTLFEVGRGKMTLAQFEDVINQRNRCAAGQSVPADGLYLTKITYPE